MGAVLKCDMGCFSLFAFLMYGRLTHGFLIYMTNLNLWIN